MRFLDHWLKFCDEISRMSTIGGGDPTDQAHDGGIGMRSSELISVIMPW
jgi:hypothetical protein